MNPTWLEFTAPHCLGALWLGSVLLSTILGGLLLFGIQLPEKQIKHALSLISRLGFFIILGITVYLVASGQHIIYHQFGDWLHSSGLHFDLGVDLEIRTSVFLLIAHLILVIVVEFSGNYLHRDPGYQRFMFLVSLFQTGIVLTITSSHFELLFLGWELVGIASFLLIGFFSGHRSASQQSLKAFTTYRICDFSIVLASVLSHRLFSTINLYRIEPLLNEAIQNHPYQLSLIAFFIIVGSLGKSGQFPFITWLPRAMEGPTPSSALFYGAISVHMGPILLIKLINFWQWSLPLVAMICAIGFVTMVLSTATGKTVANVKGQLAYAVMAQVGLIYIEIALGFINLAMVHICFHACLRVLQYLHSSSVLQDFEVNAAFFSQTPWSKKPHLISQKMFIHALNGFYVEAMFQRVLILPTMGFAKFLSSNLLFFMQSQDSRNQLSQGLSDD